MCERRSLSILFLAVLWTHTVFAAEPLHRHHDNRVPVNQKNAEKNGIRGYESKRLLLYTDIDPEKARELVKLVDQLFPTWEQQLGPLPEARDKTEFQITGYLMKDPQKFLKANLLRKNPSHILHGQNEGYEFWMHDQEWDYYREHLLLHEATHCITQCRETEDHQRPVWFLEGMAEYFGTHQPVDEAAAANIRLKFGVIPRSATASAGFGRVEMIRLECEAGRALSAADVLKLGGKEFSESRTTPYAWSWALCTFLALHPETAADFRQVCHQWETAVFMREFMNFWTRHETVIAADWELFRESLCYGFDLEHGATVRDEVMPLDPKSPRQAQVSAAQGWQSTGVSVKVGQMLHITAQGRVVLANTTKPWESEPTGISIRYSEQRPIGRLLAAIQNTQPTESGSVRYWQFFDVGEASTIKVEDAGTLFLRVNDRWNELADNSGDYNVQITAQD